MNTHIIKALLLFLKETENLKNVIRSSHISNDRNESTAEHTSILTLVF